MTGEFQLRAPKAEDTPKLASLGRDTFIETFGPLYRKEDLDHFLEESYSDTVISAELSDPKLTIFSTIISPLSDHLSTKLTTFPT